MCWLLWDWMLFYCAMPLVTPPSLVDGEEGQDVTSVPRLDGVETDTLSFTDVSTSIASNYTCTVSLFDSVIGTAVGELTTRGGDILPP